MSSLRDMKFSKYRRFSQTLQTTWIVSKNSDLVKSTLKNSEIILYTQAYLRFLYGLSFMPAFENTILLDILSSMRKIHQ